MASQVLVPILTGLVGFLGVIVGALLTAGLATRRERWTAKRDAYVAVLGSLQQIRLTYRRIEALHEKHLPLANAATREALEEEMRSKIAPEFKEARDSLYRAAAIARLTLSARAVAELDRYDQDDAIAAEAFGLFGTFSARRGAAETTFERLVEIARDELRVGKLPHTR